MSRIQLQHPIEIDGRRISAVTIRRPKKKDLKAARGRLAPILRFDTEAQMLAPNTVEFRAIIAAVAMVVGLSEKAVGELDMIDIHAIAMTAFMELGNWAERGAPGVARMH